ncbi:hypothetical protein L2E82_18820 [Cichorium intybus]|uniref:Uncharacterized protein n=1 Tax=Cichorium intybus TaxID=13427 RepID=A0ACB9FAX8_CICIN|nr:hypothetical protein L2E82_18820 [Cichorium intybus]
MSKPQTRNPLQISSSKLTTETKGFSGRTCRRSLYIVFTAIALILSTPAFILCIQFVSPLLIRVSTDNNPTTRRKSLKSTVSEAIEKFRNRIAKRKAFSAHKPLRIKRLKRDSYETALMQACQYGHWEVVLTLILYKANIHKADYLNRGTALHMAALNGHSRCIRILLADYIPSVPNFLEHVNKKSRIDEFVSELDEGWTPLAVAQSWHRDWLQEVLTEQSQDHEPIPPSPYLCIPLMSVVKIARECGWSDHSLSTCADPCAVCLENKCAVASEACYIGKEIGVRIATIEEEISLIHAKYQATTMKEFVQHSHSKNESSKEKSAQLQNHHQTVTMRWSRKQELPAKSSPETIALHEAMEKAIYGSEGSWSGSSSHCVSALQKALATQAHFVDVEIDRTSLKIGEKIASGSSGDLYVYTVLQLHFNIITFISALLFLAFSPY